MCVWLSVGCGVLGRECCAFSLYSLRGDHERELEMPADRETLLTSVSSSCASISLSVKCEIELKLSKREVPEPL